MTARTSLIIAAFVLSNCVAAAAPAVLIDSGDGSGNITAPSPDPGWNHVGRRGGGLTAVYLGNGWVLTANHVGTGSFTLGGVTYAHVPGSEVQLGNGDGTFADLLMFRVLPTPPLPPLVIASSTPPIGTDLIMIGSGVNRGPATAWDANGPPPPGPIFGYEWDTNWGMMRWGTNEVDEDPSTRVFETEVFGTHFDHNGTAHEGQAVIGDSGGATFAWTGSGYELAGILFAMWEYPNQPSNTSFYGQTTWSADLSFYRDEIVEVMPEPIGGLWAGIALLAALPFLDRLRGPR